MPRTQVIYDPSLIQGTTAHLALSYGSLFSSDGHAARHFTFGEEGFKKLTGDSFHDFTYGTLDYEELLKKNGLDSDKLRLVGNSKRVLLYERRDGTHVDIGCEFLRTRDSFRLPIFYCFIFKYVPFEKNVGKVTLKFQTRFSTVTH